MPRANKRPERRSRHLVTHHPRDRRQRADPRLDLPLNCRHRGLCLFEPSNRLEPTRRFRHPMPQEPHDQRTHTRNREHVAPAEMRNDPVADRRRAEQTGIDDQREERRPASARGRRHELAQRAGRYHQFCAETHPHDEAQQDQPVDVGCKASGDRRDTENRQVRLIRITPAEPVAEIAGQARADHHAHEGSRDEKRAEPQIGEAALDHRRERAVGQIDIECVEESARADETQNIPVETGDGQAVKPRAGIDGYCCQLCLLIKCARWGRLRKASSAWPFSRMRGFHASVRMTRLGVAEPCYAVSRHGV